MAASGPLKRRLSESTQLTLLIQSMGLGAAFAWSWCIFLCPPPDIFEVSRQWFNPWMLALCFGCAGLTLFLGTRTANATLASWQRRRLSCSLALEQILLFLGFFAILVSPLFSGFAAVFKAFGSCVAGVGFALLVSRLIIPFSRLPGESASFCSSWGLIIGAGLVWFYTSLYEVPAIIFVFLLAPVSSFLTVQAFRRLRKDQYQSRNPITWDSSLLWDEIRGPLRTLVAILFLYAMAVGFACTAISELLAAPSIGILAFVLGVVIVAVVVLVFDWRAKRVLHETFVARIGSLLIATSLLLLFVLPTNALSVSATFVMAGWALMEIGGWSAASSILGKKTLFQSEMCFIGARIAVFCGISFGLVLYPMFKALFPDYQWINWIALVMLIAAILAATFVVPKADVWLSSGSENLQGKRSSDSVSDFSESEGQDRGANSGPMNLPASSLDEACAAIASGYGLTGRESEVLELLARGRNARSIEQALVLSNSTVKTHIRHVYEKCGVHGHQEILDLVEKWSGRI